MGKKIITLMTDRLSYDSITDLSFNVSHHEESNCPWPFERVSGNTVTIRKVETKLLSY